MSQYPHGPSGYPPHSYPPGYGYPPPPNTAYPMPGPSPGYGYGYPPPPGSHPTHYYGHAPPPNIYGYGPPMPAPAPAHPLPVASISQLHHQPPPVSFVPFTPNPEDGAQIETWFQELDTDYDGFIGGADVVPFFQRSNINKPVLRDLWNLVDYHKNGKLDRKQFIIAIRMLAVLCSPIYAGSSPTVELFNSTANKPISLPIQMYKSVSVAPIATSTVAASKPSSAIDLLLVNPVPDAQFPPLQAPVPPASTSSKPPPSGAGISPYAAAMYPYNVPPIDSRIVQPGYPNALPNVNYPGNHVIVSQAVPVPTSAATDDDEFSDFSSAAPVTTTAVSITASVTMEATQSSLVVDKEEKWEFVSAQPPSQGSILSVAPTPSFISSIAHSLNISMLSLDLDDIVMASVPAISVTLGKEDLAQTQAADSDITSVLKENDKGMDFDDFQQALLISTTPAVLSEVVNPASTNATLLASSASSLVILDEIIEQDLKMAAEEAWEDFEGPQTAATEPINAYEVEVQSIVRPPMLSEAPAIPIQVLDNPFDMLDFMDTLHIATLDNDNPFSDVIESSAIASTVTAVASMITPMSATTEDGEEDDYDDYGGFASHDHSPISTFRNVVPASESTKPEYVLAVFPASEPKEEDPFAELEIQSPIEPFDLPISIGKVGSAEAMDASARIQDNASNVQNRIEVEDDSFGKVDLQASEHPNTVTNNGNAEIASEPLETLTNNKVMIRQAASLDFLDLDFGPVVNSAPLPLLNVPAPIPSIEATTTAIACSNKRVDLLDLLDNVYGVGNPTSHTVPTSTSWPTDDDENYFHPFVGSAAEDSHIHKVVSNVHVGDTNQEDDDDDNDDDFEPFQSTPSPSTFTTIKATDVLSSVSISVETQNVVDFDPFATGGSVEEDDFFVDTAPTTIASVPASKSSTIEVSYKTALTTADLESLAQHLAKKHLYDEAYACAKQASVLRTIASLSEAINLALENDDLETAQSIKKETQLWTQQLVDAAMERHWQRMAHDAKRQGASIDEMYENLTLMDQPAARKFHQKYFNDPSTASSSSSAFAQCHDIRNVDGTKYYRPAPNNPNISLELRMKYHVLLKRSARMIMAITSSHRQHIQAWKQYLDTLQKFLTEQDRHWTTTFGKKSTLSATDKHSLANSSEVTRKYLDPLITSCEMALWMSATCQESLVHEEEARKLWRLAQPLLLEIEETLHLRNKFARISLEDMSISAGEMSECTGQVTYCNFSLRPLRIRYQDETTAEIILYAHEKMDKTSGIAYALPLWNIWMARKLGPLPSSDGLFM